MNGRHKGQAQEFSACPPSNGKPLGGRESKEVQVVGSDTIRFAFCEDHIRNCVNLFAVQQE